MTSAVTALILSFVVTTLATPIVCSWANSVGAVDQPGGRRIHVRITPRLGGIAVMLGFFVPLALFAFVQTGAMEGFLRERHLVFGLVLGSVVVGTVGVVDDIRGVGPWPKLFAQAVAGTIAYSSGYCIKAINLPFFGDIDMGPLALLVTVFWFLAITNAINLIDGLDGLAAGITFFATLTNFAIAKVNGSSVAVLLSAALGGSLLGFLRHNFNPATIFLGDSGSMFLGFCLAATSLAGGMTKSSTAVALLAPIIALGVPLLDTFLTMIRRTLARQSIFAADRGHIHHRLLDLGFTHRRVVVLLYFFSILLALSAIAIAFGRSWNVGLALVAVGAALFALVRIGFHLPSSRTAPPVRQGSLARLRERVESALGQVHSSSNEVDLHHVLSLLENSESPLVKLRVLDPETRESAEGRDRNVTTFEFSVGSAKRYVEMRFCRELSPDEREQILLCTAALVEACGQSLARFSVDSVELSPIARAGTQVVGARSS